MVKKHFKAKLKQKTTDQRGTKKRNRRNSRKTVQFNFNGVVVVKKHFKPKPKQKTTDQRGTEKRIRRISHFTKYKTLSESEKVILGKVGLVGDYITTLFDRRRYLDDSCALYGLKLLREKFSEIGGFQSVLLGLKPEQRDKNYHVSAEIFHCMGSRHYVCAVLLSPDVVAYMDSLHPGTMPPDGVIKQISASFRVNKKYSIRSLQCQVQGASDCLVCAIANLDAVLSGNDISKLEFDNKWVRSFFVES